MDTSIPTTREGRRTNPLSNRSRGHNHVERGGHNPTHSKSKFELPDNNIYVVGIQGHSTSTTQIHGACTIGIG
jgi:hypothetical protein